MAIDTRQKRFSMLSLGSPIESVIFEADGAVDSDDKYHLLRLYSGIELGEAVEPEPEVVEQNTGGWENRGNYDFLNPVERKQEEVEQDEQQPKQPTQILPGVKLKKKLDEVNTEIRKAEKSINLQPVQQQEETKDYLIKLYIELNALQEQLKRQEELDIVFITMMMIANE